LLSGTCRRGKDMECLLVYNEAEKCYMLEKLDVVYQDLNPKDAQAISSQPEGDMILPQTTVIINPPPISNTSSSGTTDMENEFGARSETGITPP